MSLAASPSLSCLRLDMVLRSGSFQSWLEMKYNESKAKSVEEGEIEVEEVEELHKASASLTVHEGRQLRHSGDGGRDVRLVVGSYGLQVRLPHRSRGACLRVRAVRRGIAHSGQSGHPAGGCRTATDAGKSTRGRPMPSPPHQP